MTFSSLIYMYPYDTSSNLFVNRILWTQMGIHLKNVSALRNQELTGSDERYKSNLEIGRQ